MQAVKLSREGMSAADIARHFGVSPRAVFYWLTMFQEGGQAALLAKDGAGRPPTLKPEQLSWIAAAVRDHTPDQLRFGFGLWTLRLIGELIERQFQRYPSKPTLIKLMRMLGFTPQRPVRRAWQEDDVVVQRWRSEEFPALAARAKARGATLLFGDESGLRSDYHAGTTWAPRGQTPVVPATGQRFSIPMLSAVSALGEVHFMLHEGRVNSEVFVHFLKQLMHGRTRPVILVLDGHSIHKSKMVKDYVATAAGQLELAYLPPYSPELNPDEQVWKSVKAHVAKKVPTDKSHMRELILGAFGHLVRAAHVVLGFFRHPECRYAMA